MSEILLIAISAGSFSWWGFLGFGGGFLNCEPTSGQAHTRGTPVGLPGGFVFVAAGVGALCPMSVRVSGHAPPSPASRLAALASAGCSPFPPPPSCTVPLASVEQQYVRKHVCFSASFTMCLRI